MAGGQGCLCQPSCFHPEAPPACLPARPPARPPRQMQAGTWPQVWPLSRLKATQLPPAPWSEPTSELPSDLSEPGRATCGDVFTALMTGALQAIGAAPPPPDAAWPCIQCFSLGLVSWVSLMPVTQPRSRSGPEYQPLGQPRWLDREWTGSRPAACATRCPQETCPQLPWSGQRHTHCSPSWGGTAPPHDSGSRTHSLWAKDRQGEEGTVEYSSVIPGKSTRSSVRGSFILS